MACGQLGWIFYNRRRSSSSPTSWVTVAHIHSHTGCIKHIQCITYTVYSVLCILKRHCTLFHRSSCLSHFNLCGVNMMHTYTSIFTCVLWTIDRLLGHSNLMWLCFIFLVHHIWFRQKSLIFIFQVRGLASICIWYVEIHFYWISQCWVDLIGNLW